MSLVYPAADPGTYDPMTHVLIIGVGEYLYLPGGPEFAIKPAKYALGLKQLTSPPVSAQKLANWIIDNLTSSHKNPKVPLGTVELLLSPQAYTDQHGNLTQVESATFDNIRNAFERWFDRCDRHPENIAIFYFCGHGLEWDKTYLFASDYGKSSANPWENVIDFNISRMGFLGECQATTLCCFLDACRGMDLELIKQFNIAARPLRDVSCPPKGDRDAPIFKAANFGEKAHGPPGGISYFAQALIDCLERLGAGGPPVGTTWRVNTNSLGLALRPLIRRRVIPNVGPGACDVGGQSNTPEPTILHELPGVADAIAEITYNPEIALEHAELSCCPLGSGSSPITRPPDPSSWHIEVAAGFYNLAAQFQSGLFPNRQISAQIIWPPFTRCTL